MTATTAAPPADALELFHPLVRQWFTERVGTPTDVQTAAWPRIAGGDNVLVTAPTGSGDTPQEDRRRMLRQPEILITTPESLNLLVSSQGGRGLLSGLQTVIDPSGQLLIFQSVTGDYRESRWNTAAESVSWPLSPTHPLERSLSWRRM